ncbi:hypothetical protein ABZP36_019717 [Zizania latifolia]
MYHGQRLTAEKLHVLPNHSAVADDDEAKLRRPYSSLRAPSSSSSSASTNRLLLLFALTYLLIDVASLAFAFSPRTAAAHLHQPPHATVAVAAVAFRCGRVEDSLLPHAVCWWIGFGDGGTLSSRVDWGQRRRMLSVSVQLSSDLKHGRIVATDGLKSVRALP